MKPYKFVYKDTQNSCNELYEICCKAANGLYKGKPPTKFDIETNPQIVSILQSIETFKIYNKINIKNIRHKVGSIGICNIYRNMFLLDNHILINANDKTAKIVISGL